MSKHAYPSSNKAANKHEFSQFNPSRLFTRIRDRFLKHGIRKVFFRPRQNPSLKFLRRLSSACMLSILSRKQHPLKYILENINICIFSLTIKKTSKKCTAKVNSNSIYFIIFLFCYK